MAGELELTGERMVPHGADPKTFWEHVDRYRFACTMAREQDTLDIACGEGYGSAALLQAGAKTLVGVDIAAAAVDHAKRVYGIDARVGDAEAIPLADRSVDYIVSFETIEHVPRPAAFLTECVRVMRPDGSLLISTPNLQRYRETTPHNPFHCSEMSVEDFETLLNSFFEDVEYFGQAPPLPRWTGLRGGGKLLRSGLRLLNPDYLSPLSEEKQRDVVNLCQQRISGLGNYLTQTAVRKVRPSELAKCMYVLARAGKPRGR